MKINEQIREAYARWRAFGDGARHALTLARIEADPPPDLRVRWEPEDLALEMTFDDSVTDLRKLAEQIDSGELDYLCALVERRCECCSAWSVVGSLGAVCAPPDDPYWRYVGLELLDEHRDEERNEAT